MTEMLAGASGSSAVPTWTRWAPEGCHSTDIVPPPGHGSPPGKDASKRHLPTSGSSRRSASWAVGWSTGPSCGSAAGAGDRAVEPAVVLGAGAVGDGEVG